MLIPINTEDGKIEVAFSVYEDYPVYAFSKEIQQNSSVIKIDKSLYERYEKAQEEWYLIQKIIAELDK